MLDMFGNAYSPFAGPDSGTIVTSAGAIQVEGPGGVRDELGDQAAANVTALANLEARTAFYGADSPEAAAAATAVLGGANAAAGGATGSNVIGAPQAPPGSAAAGGGGGGVPTRSRRGAGWGIVLAALFGLYLLARK